MSLGENIYRLRSRKNLSQGDLADLLNISRQSVSRWETGSALKVKRNLHKSRKNGNQHK